MCMQVATVMRQKYAVVKRYKCIHQQQKSSKVTSRVISLTHSHSLTVIKISLRPDLHSTLRPIRRLIVKSCF